MKYAIAECLVEGEKKYRVKDTHHRRYVSKPISKEAAEELLKKVAAGADPRDIDRKNLNYLACQARWSNAVS